MTLSELLDEQWVKDLNCAEGDRKLLAIRTHRTQLLFDSDWTQVLDSPLSEQKRSEWANYRQQLRDIIETYSNNIDAIIFPDKPKDN